MMKLLALGLCGTALLATGCNQSRSDTNRPPIISGITATPSGAAIGPDQQIVLQLDYTDPDESAPNPQSYTHTWTVSALAGTVGPPNLPATLLVADANPGVWRAPLEEGFYRLTGQVCDRFNDCAIAELTLQVDRDALPNTAPRITSVTIDNTTPSTGIPVNCTVTAVDDDGDPLSYEWTASKGTFSSITGAGATWIGSQTGGATITVTVSDDRGGSVEHDFAVNVV